MVGRNSSGQQCPKLGTSYDKSEVEHPSDGHHKFQGTTLMDQRKSQVSE